MERSGIQAITIPAIKGKEAARDGGAGEGQCVCVKPTSAADEGGKKSYLLLC